MIPHNGSRPRDARGRLWDQEVIKRCPEPLHRLRSSNRRFVLPIPLVGDHRATQGRHEHVLKGIRGQHHAQDGCGAIPHRLRRTLLQLTAPRRSRLSGPQWKKQDPLRLLKPHIQAGRFPRDGHQHATNGFFLRCFSCRKRRNTRPQVCARHQVNHPGPIHRKNQRSVAACRDRSVRAAWEDCGEATAALRYPRRSRCGPQVGKHR